MSRGCHVEESRGVLRGGQVKGVHASRGCHALLWLSESMGCCVVGVG